MTKPDVQMVLLDCDLNGIPSLSNVDLATLKKDAVYTRCFQIKVILVMSKETGDPPTQEACSFCYVMIRTVVPTPSL
jgi:hypothetical protein